MKKRRKRKPSVNGSRKRIADREAAKPDEITRMLQSFHAELQAMTTDEIFAAAVRVGIYTKDGKLTKRYR